VRLAGSVMLVRARLSWNAELPRLVRAEGMAILGRLPQFLNAELPMLVRLSGSVMLVRPTLFSNAESPILVTPSGIITLFKPNKALNADFPMLVTGTPPIVAGMTISPPGPLKEVIVPEVASNPKDSSSVGVTASIMRTSSASKPQSEVFAKGDLDKLSPPSNCARNDSERRLPRVRRRLGVLLSNSSRRLDHNVFRADMKTPYD